MNRVRLGPARGVVLAVLAAAAGCGGGPREKAVYKVHGRLTFHGGPMAGAEIAFASVDPAQRDIQPRGTADANGEYTLTSYRQHDGAPAGDYVVTVYWPAPLSRRAAEKLEKAETVEEKDQVVALDRLRDVYRFAASTRLRATVATKENVIDFALPP